MDVQARSPRSAPCPTCGWFDGFHSAQTHAEVVIDPKLFKAKDWHKNADQKS